MQFCGFLFLERAAYCDVANPLVRLTLHMVTLRRNWSNPTLGKWPKIQLYGVHFLKSVLKMHPDNLFWPSEPIGDLTLTRLTFPMVTLTRILFGSIVEKLSRTTYFKKQTIWKSHIGQTYISMATPRSNCFGPIVEKYSSVKHCRVQIWKDHRKYLLYHLFWQSNHIGESYSG